MTPTPVSGTYTLKHPVTGRKNDGSYVSIVAVNQVVLDADEGIVQKFYSVDGQWLYINEVTPLAAI